jgi:hypothetical protein
MQLNNPAQQRTLVDIIAALPDDVKNEAAIRIAKLGRTLEQQNRFDAQVAESLDRILMNAPAETLRPLAQQIRKRIREISRRD